MHTTALHIADPRRQAPSRPSPASGPEPPAENPRRAIGAALGYLLVLELTGLMFVWTRRGQELDGRLTGPVVGGGGYLERSSQAAGPAHVLLDFVGNTLTLTVLLLLVLLAGVLSRRLLAAVAGVAAAGCSVAVATILKVAVPRPDFGIDGSAMSSSFPSGHVAATTGLVLALMLALPAGARRALAIPGAAAIAAVASATMIVGWHRFSDAVGGIVLASMMCALAAAALAGRSAIAGSGPRLAGGFAIAVGPLLFVIVAALSVHPGPLTAIMLITGFAGLSMLAMTLVLIPSSRAPGTRHEPDLRAPGQLSGSGW